jgi:hypothetical protein
MPRPLASGPCECLEVFLHLDAPLRLAARALACGFGHAPFTRGVDDEALEFFGNVIRVARQAEQSGVSLPYRIDGAAVAVSSSSSATRTHSVLATVCTESSRGVWCELAPFSAKSSL